MKNSRFSTKLVGNNQSYVYLEFSLRVTALMEFRHDDRYDIYSDGLHGREEI